MKAKIALFCNVKEEAVVTARDVESIYEVPLAFHEQGLDERRISGSQIAVEHVIGEVEGRNVVIVDDMISTGGSISEAAGIVRRHGAQRVVVAVTHAVLCGPAIERLDAAPIDKLLVTDSIPLAERRPKNVQVVTVAPLLAQAIRNIHRNESVSSLFD
jgi:ribose-phosphate pyrophosphokinase